MGLLEKALEFKKEINSKRHETLIDTTKGPAETDIIDEESFSSIIENEARQSDIVLSLPFEEKKNSAQLASENRVIDNDFIIDDEAADIQTTNTEFDTNNVSNELGTKDVPSESKLTNNDEFSYFDNYELAEENEKHSESDDLFDLPEDDNYSPLDAIKNQKSKLNEAPYDPELDEKIGKENIGKTLSDAEDIPNPLGADDEPVLPDNIDAEERQDTTIEEIELAPIVNNNITDIGNQTESEIPAIEPVNSIDKISEDNNNETSEPETILELHETDIVEIKNNDSHIENINEGHSQNFMTLYEIGKEISRVETKKALYEVTLFSIMGQIGTSTALILIGESNEDNNWYIVNSSGSKKEELPISFNPSSEILKHLKKDILYLEKYKNISDYSNQYLQLNKIGAKLLSPWNYKGKTFGALILGNKITEEEYSKEEKNFILSICEASAIELHRIRSNEKFKKELQYTKSDLNFFQHLNEVQEEIILQSTLQNAKEIIKKELENLGLIIYSVFINDVKKNKYVSLIVENEDYLSIDESNLGFTKTNSFISYIKKSRDRLKLKDFDRLDFVKEAFEETLIKKMSLLWVYPFIVGSQLIGFITVFKVNEKVLLTDKSRDDFDKKISKLTIMLFPNLLNIRSIDPEENRFLDNVEIIYQKIDSELIKSRDLKIPLTLVLFSIKNFKRYSNLFGYEKSRQLIEKFVELITSRLSETDFLARFDKNKILVALPGKDKKFATPFANIIRNEFTQSFKKKEMQLLITFLTSEYPENGEDLWNLMDYID